MSLRNQFCAFIQRTRSPMAKGKATDWVAELKSKCVHKCIGLKMFNARKVVIQFDGGEQVKAITLAYATKRIKCGSELKKIQLNHMRIICKN